MVTAASSSLRGSSVPGLPLMVLGGLLHRSRSWRGAVLTLHSLVGLLYRPVVASHLPRASGSPRHQSAPSERQSLSWGGSLRPYNHTHKNPKRVVGRRENPKKPRKKPQKPSEPPVTRLLAMMRGQRGSRSAPTRPQEESLSAGRPPFGPPGLLRRRGRSRPGSARPATAGRRRARSRKPGLNRLYCGGVSECTMSNNLTRPVRTLLARALLE